MKQTKFKFTIFALVITFIFSVTAFFAVNFTKTADAAGTVSISGTNVFTATGANVVVTNPDDDNKQYTMFTFGDNEDVVSYRKNLAYSWWSKLPDEEKNEDGQVTVITHEPEHGLFNMEIGFRNLNFEKFVITFESQQYFKTEDSKTVNYIMFFPSEDGQSVNVIITDDKDATPDAGADKAVAHLSPDKISISFTEKEEFPETLAGGEYGVTVESGATRVTGIMKNIGGNYAKYSSSSTKPVYPLMFGAEFPAEEEQDGERKAAQMVLYSLNNQSFLINEKSATEDDSGEFYTGGTVTDDTPAVICLNKEISYLNVGGSVKFEYQAIDVIRSSPSTTLYYYQLSVDDYKKDDVNFDDYKDTATSDKTGRFNEVKADTLLDSDTVFYKPTGNDLNGFAQNLNVDMAVKVYAKVLDTTSNGAESYVFFDWYLDDEHKLKIKDSDFIAVGNDDDGVTYNYGAGNKTFASDNEILKSYQAKVDEAAKDLSAGSLSYFYLPSAEELFADNATAYSNMKISIYYYYGSNKSQNSSLSTNNLSINITRADSCWFTLYATDTASNDMYYIDENGERVEFKTGEIWEIFEDEERHDYLPWFHFKVNYKGVHFKETPGKQSTAYVGNEYTSASFEINGVENSYQTKYRLFLFNRAQYFNDNNGATFTYEQFIEKMDGLFEGSETRKYFKEIKEVTENDEDYEEFKDYQWSSTSTSFVPQDGNAFYYIRAEVTDTAYNVKPVTCSLAVVASEEAKALQGDSEWLQNNIASVILLSVAGVSLIAIILLLVIKPKSKEDIDVQFEQEKSKKKNK